MGRVPLDSTVPDPIRDSVAQAVSQIRDTVRAVREMKKKSNLAKRLEAASPKLEDVEPGFRVPEFQTDEEEIAWLDRNHERLVDLTLKHGARVQLALREPTRQISIRLPVRDLERAKQIAA